MFTFFMNTNENGKKKLGTQDKIKQIIPHNDKAKSRFVITLQIY